ncbi:MAG: type II toxin-antitoxin system RelE/ParE family toxin [Flavobacteriales bacterium]
MSYSIIATPNFRKELKALAKRYRSLKNEYADLISRLEKDPEQGTSLGNDCYKIRLSIESKNKGKSGGARVITCVKIINETVFLVSIFDKSEKENISDKQLKELLKSLF